MDNAPISIDDVIADYASRAREIYEKRTQGDYTWEGFLCTFLIEIDYFTSA